MAACVSRCLGFGNLLQPFHLKSALKGVQLLLIST